MNFLILAKSWVLEVFNSEYQLLLCKMGTIQDSILLCLEILRVRFCHLLVSINKVADWIDDMILDILDERVDEWASNISDPALDPDIVVQEIPLSSKNAQVESKCVIFTIDNRNEAISHLLGDIENSG